ncbi:hypothetical protein Pmani_020074 [Petrolisthes manimaculis]|uniref:PH domain-containing protein n=1 Tax=Petrolisthes manimaculis TaxID=1843537 RepID=A0AAE1PJJ2_9EUCA|nr:hypothetical protein Pmani_020074 [Petrolisthes manimaculis]
MKVMLWVIDTGEAWPRRDGSGRCCSAAGDPPPLTHSRPMHLQAGWAGRGGAGAWGNGNRCMGSGRNLGVLYSEEAGKSGRRKERGRVALSRVVAVECVDSAVFQRDWVFQLCYLSDEKEQYVLYIAAVISQEREQWLDYLRRLVADNEGLAEWYHQGAFVKSQWSCCKSGKEDAPCTAVTWTINHNNNPPGRIPSPVGLGG